MTEGGTKWGQSVTSLYGLCRQWDQKKKSPNEWRHQFTRNTCRQYCIKKRL